MWCSALKSTPSSNVTGTTSGARYRCHSPTLALGGAITVTTLDDKESLTIPKGTQTGQKFRLRGKGMPRVSGRGHGDLYVLVQASVPTKLSREQKDLLEQLDKTMPDKSSDPTGHAESEDQPFFDRVRDIFG